MELLNLSIPVFQAPTGSIAGPELAMAVAEAGGMGGLGLTWTEADAARRAVRQIKAVTQGQFQGNFALAFEPVALGPVLDEGIPCVTFSWGDPSPYVKDVRSAGAGLGIQVTNPEGAKRALEHGPDFLIVQGIEAGGHVQSTTSLARLLPAIRAVAGDVPLVAAGGIADGQGIATALNLGASAAMLGTRFVATQESLAHPEYKQALLEADDTALTICFDGGWSGAPHRVLRNETFVRWEAAGCPPNGRRPGEGETLAISSGGEAIFRYEDTAPRQGMAGAVREMCLYAGEGVGQIHDLPKAGDLVRRLWAECLEIRI